MEHRYKLEKYTTNAASRHQCPACNDKSSFVYYIDSETNAPIHYTCGKCNHESGCGYHYTPKQYFIDNDIKNEWKPTQQTKPAEPLRPLGTLNFDLVERSASYQSNFVRFLFDIFDHNSNINPTIVRLCQSYALGATKAKEVIFWQIDINGIVRTGKVMQYGHATGKRQNVDWIHSRMIKANQLQSDYNLKQCFFGEHLLRLNPVATIAIVESEKTAIIASGLMPDFIWLAAGQLQGLNIDKCEVLKGRNIVFFPDLSEKKENRMTAFEVWSAKASEIMRAYKCKIIVSDLLERKATDSERQNGFDIADYLIKEQFKKAQSKVLVDMMTKKPALEILIDTLQLSEV
jgi:hypothetical protein